MDVCGVGVSYNAKESTMADQMNDMETPKFSGAELLREAREAFKKGALWASGWQVDEGHIEEKAKQEYPIKVFKPNIVKVADENLWVIASTTNEIVEVYNHPTDHTYGSLVYNPRISRAFLAAAAQALATPYIETSE
jgi:hypothetical protein